MFQIQNWRASKLTVDKFINSIGVKLAAVMLVLGLVVLFVGGAGWLSLKNTGTVVTDMAAKGTQLSTVVDRQSELLSQTVDVSNQMSEISGEMGTKLREVGSLFSEFSSKLEEERERALETLGQALLSLLSERENTARSIIAGITETKEIKELAAGFPDAQASDQLTDWMDQRKEATDIDFYTALPGEEGTKTVIASDLVFNGIDIGHVESIKIAREDEEVSSSATLVNDRLIILASGMLMTDSYDYLAVLSAGYNIDHFRIKELARSIGADISLFIPSLGDQIIETSFDAETLPDISKHTLPKRLVKRFNKIIAADYKDSENKLEVQQKLRRHWPLSLNDREFDTLYQGILNGRGELIAIMMISVDVTKITQELASIDAAVSSISVTAFTVETKRHEVNKFSQQAQTEAIAIFDEVSAVRDGLEQLTGTANKTLQNSQTTSIIAILAAALIVVFAIFMVRGVVAKPIEAMTQSMRKLANGDLEAEIPALHKKDEIGKMAQSVQIFKENALRVKQLEAETIEQEKAAEEQRKKAMHETADRFEANVQGIVHTVRETSAQLNELASGMSNAAEDVGNASENAASASTNISQNVDAVAIASEELSSSIDEITRQISHALDASSSAAGLSSDATENVTSLSDKVTEIKEVVSLITNIADQTNLLALNATIEAARAGEAGKGFAVVASEVKSLANQTAKATEQIDSQITGVVEATETTVKGFTEINTAISDVQNTSTIISSAIEEQGAATREIASNASQTAQDVNLVASTVEEVKEGAQSNASRAQQVQASSEKLQEQSEALQEQLTDFLQMLRMS